MLSPLGNAGRLDAQRSGDSGLRTEVPDDIVFGHGAILGAPKPICNRRTLANKRHALPMPTLGKRSEALRISRGLSQAELARQIGVKQPSLHAIESGETKSLKATTLAALCRVLQVHQDCILRSGGQLDEASLHEAELIQSWRSLPRESRDHLLGIVRAMVKTTAPAPSADTQSAPAPKRRTYTTKSGALS